MFPAPPLPDMTPPPLPPEGAIDAVAEPTPFICGCVGVGIEAFCPILALLGAGLGADMFLVSNELNAWNDL